MWPIWKGYPIRKSNFASHFPFFIFSLKRWGRLTWVTWVLIISLGRLFQWSTYNSIAKKRLRVSVLATWRTKFKGAQVSLVILAGLLPTKVNQVFGSIWSMILKAWTRSHCLDELHFINQENLKNGLMFLLHTARLKNDNQLWPEADFWEWFYRCIKLLNAKILQKN